MKMKKFAIVLAVVSVMFISCGSAWGISLTFQPSDLTVGLSESFDIDIMISGLEDADLSSFDLTVNYDVNKLSFDSYALGGELTDPFWGQDDWSLGDIGGGQIHLSEISWLMDFSGQPDAFSLATLSFTAIGVGETFLALSDVILGDACGNPLEYNFGPVSSVPEPSTIFLFGFGLIGLAAIRRRFSK